MAGDVVLDASALVEALIASPLGEAVWARLAGEVLHAPAHVDAQVLSAIGRLNRAGELYEDAAASALDRLVAAPIRRHPLGPLVRSTWERRHSLRLADALYVELAASMGAPLISTDARLARTVELVELVVR